MSYKKRAKAGWETDKRSSNRSERQYEKREIRQALEEEFQGDDYRYSFQSKRRFDTPLDRDIHKMRKRVAWDERFWDSVKSKKSYPESSFWARWKNSIYSRLQKNKEKLKKLLDKKEKK